MLKMLTACGDKMEMSDMMCIVLNALGLEYETFREINDHLDERDNDLRRSPGHVAQL